VQTRFSSLRAPGPKIVAPSYRHLSRNRQEEKPWAAPNVPVFPGMRQRSADDRAAEALGKIAAFS